MLTMSANLLHDNILFNITQEVRVSTCKLSLTESDESYPPSETAPSPRHSEAL